jgi:hypothetical protein
MEVSIWDQILSRIETKVNRHSFYTWFKPTSLVLDAGAPSACGAEPALQGLAGKALLLVLSEALTEVQRPDDLAGLPSGGRRAARSAGTVAPVPCR